MIFNSCHVTFLRWVIWIDEIYSDACFAEATCSSNAMEVSLEIWLAFSIQGHVIVDNKWNLVKKYTCYYG